MARAHGPGVTGIAGAFAPSARLRLTPAGRLRGFNLPHAVGEFNAAASERARLARLTYDLATHASDRACVRAAPALSAIDEILALGETFSSQLAQPLRERAHFGLHSELRVALDEGRRLQIADLDGLALSAVYSAAAGLLAERADELALALDVPAAVAAGADQWYKLLCAAPAADNPRAFIQDALRQRAQAELLARSVA